MQLVQVYLVDERSNPVICDADLQHTIASLLSIQSLRREAAPGLSGLLDLLRVAHDPSVLSDQPAVGPITFIHSGMLQARSRDFEDGLPEKSEYLLREWVAAYSPGQRDYNKNFALLLQQVSDVD